MAVFFGARSSLNRFSFLRSNVAFIRSVVAFPNTRLIFYRKSQTDGSLQVYASKKSSNPRIVYLPLDYNEQIKALLGRWAMINEEATKSSINIRRRLNFTCVFLGMDENPGTKDSVFPEEHDSRHLARLTFEKHSGIPVLAVDISGNAEFQDLLDKIIDDAEFTSSITDILNLSPIDAAVFSYAKMYLDWLLKNQFCPGCGSSVSPIWAGTKLQCTNEEKEVGKDGESVFKCPVRRTRVNNVCFPRIDPVVIIALRNGKGDKILLGHNARRKQLDKRFFSCFSGFMELGETIRSTVIREVWEETGLKLKNNIKIIKSQPWPFPANLMIGCIGTTEEGSENNITTHLDCELDHLEWFDANYIADIVYGRPTDGRIKLPQKGSVAFELIKMVTDDCISTKL